MAKARQRFTNTGTFTAPAGVAYVEVVARVKRRGLLSLSAGGGATGRVNGFIDQNGDLFMMGLGINGQLGNNDFTSRSSPVLVVGGQKWKKVISNGFTTIGLNTSGQVYCWGLNTNGNVGDGTTADKSTPTLVVGMNNLKFMDVTINRGGGMYALATNGLGYAWGNNLNGALGLGDVTPRSSPVLISASLQFKKIVPTADGTNLACYFLSPFGQLYAAGKNDQGQLGIGNVTDKSTPTLVVGGYSFTNVVATEKFAIALDASGNPYKWGQGAPASAAAASSPVLLAGGLTFVDIAVCKDSAQFLKSNGSLYAMGNNSAGQIGDGTVTSRSSITAVIGGFSFSKIFNSDGSGVSGQESIYAISKAGGQLYCWGDNTQGQLGLGDVVARSSPCLIAGTFSYKEVSTDSDTVVMLGEDGSIITVGNNFTGQLGQNITGGIFSASSSPTLIAGNNLGNALDKVVVSRCDVSPGSAYQVLLGQYFAKFGDVQVGDEFPESVEVYFDQ